MSKVGLDVFFLGFDSVFKKTTEREPDTSTSQIHPLKCFSSTILPARFTCTLSTSVRSLHHYI